MTLPRYTVLIVDDSPEDRAIFARCLRKDPLYTYRCIEASSGGDALELCVHGDTIDCVVLDYHLPDMNGSELIAQIKAALGQQGPGLVMVTGLGSEQLAVDSLKSGAHDYLTKMNAAAPELQRAVANAIEKAALQQLLHRQSQELIAQHRLLEQQSRAFQNTLNNIPAIVSRFDRELRHVYINAEIERATGLSPAFYHNKTNRELGMPADLCDLWDGVITQVFETGDPLTLQFTTPFVERPHYFQSRIVAERSPSGEVLSVLSVTLDQTEQREAEHALRMIADASIQLSESLDLEGTLTQISALMVPQYADTLAIDRVDPQQHIERLALARTVDGRMERIAEEEQLALPDEVVANLQAVMVAQRPMLYSAERQPDNPQATMQVLHLPLIIRQEPIGVLTLVRLWGRAPFSEREQNLLEELGRRVTVAIDNALLYSEAQRAIHDREAFLSIASHELKNPLTSMIGRAELLLRRGQRNNIDERSLKDIYTIVEQGRRMTMLLNDLLDVSRFDLGLLQLKRAAVDVAALVRNAASDAELHSSRHTFTIVGADSPVIVICDAARFEQVLRNLLSNAVKYSPDGGTITLTISSSLERVEVRVADQGIGIAAVDLPRLFRRFYRVNQGRASSINGSGIGLYVVQQIVALHSGTVSVESRPGEGSTFIVSLPRFALADRQITITDQDDP